METVDRVKVAALLRNAASRTISEERFWVETKAVTDRVGAPILNVAIASATAYWQLFHAPKKFWMKVTKPDAAELRQARDELNLIAAVLETGWQLPELPDITADLE
jgi:hypothetical protein